MKPWMPALGAWADFKQMTKCWPKWSKIIEEAAISYVGLCSSESRKFKGRGKAKFAQRKNTGNSIPDPKNECIRAKDRSDPTIAIERLANRCTTIADRELDLSRKKM